VTAFTLTSSEGLPIRGDLQADDAARALVILVHGFKGFKDWGFFPWLAELLYEHGFAVCRFNMARSGMGEHPETFERLDLFEHDTYSQQLLDLHAVASFAQTRFPSLPAFVAGHSRGGGVALLGATDALENLAGVITWNSISRVDRWDAATIARWRRNGYVEVENARTKQMMRMSTAMLDDVEAHPEPLEILAAAARLPVPLLVIHSGRDESVPSDESRAIASHARDAVRVEIANAGHTFNAIHPLVHVPFALSLAGELTAQFIEAHRRRA
jgi:pimeloyl-ACP methyl ester carboxylesterase